MLFVMLEDTKGKIEILVFPKVLERIGSVWEEERMIISELIKNYIPSNEYNVA